MDPKLLFLACCVLKITHSLEVIPERPNITYVNQDFVEWVNLTVTRLGRRSPYVLNIQVVIKQPWGNNVSVLLQHSEFLSNMYRPSFIEFRTKLCDFVNNEPYIGTLLAKAGLAGKSCPYAAGQYNLMNITTKFDNFNFVWPFEKSRMDINVTRTETKVTIFAGYLHLIFKQKPRAKLN